MACFFVCQGETAQIENCVYVIIFVPTRQLFHMTATYGRIHPIWRAYIRALVHKRKKQMKEHVKHIKIFEDMKIFLVAIFTSSFIAIVTNFHTVFGDYRVEKKKKNLHCLLLILFLYSIGTGTYLI
jgi:hypothetical protein